MPTNSPPDTPDEPHDVLLYWIAQAAKRARHRSGKSPETFAAHIGGEELNASTLRRFEAGIHVRVRDDVMACYAMAFFKDDARNLLTEAVRLWKKEGTPPEVPLRARKIWEAIQTMDGP